MDTGIPLREADTLRASFDSVVIGFARLARAPPILPAALDAGQLSRLQRAAPARRELPRRAGRV